MRLLAQLTILSTNMLLIKEEIVHTKQHTYLYSTKYYRASFPFVVKLFNYMGQQSYACIAIDISYGSAAHQRGIAKM